MIIIANVVHKMLLNLFPGTVYLLQGRWEFCVGLAGALCSNIIVSYLRPMLIYYA